jgi:hypothetical protein
MWLLQNTIKNQVPENLLFEHPNVMLFAKPFKRITNLFYNIVPYDDIALRRKSRERSRNLQSAVMKMKLFEYATFYR